MMSNQKDGQNDPTWDGELAGWPDYVRRVRLQYETTSRKKRRLLGPRLALRLTGKAWEASTNIQHEMLRRSNGAKYLLLFLREKLGKTPIPDAAQRLEDLFIRLRRAPGTPFTTWASQVRETYKRAQRALVRARQDQAPEAVSTKSSKLSHHGDSTPGSRRQTASEPQHEPPSPQQASPSRSRGTNPFAAEVEEAEGEEAGDEWNDADGWWNDDQWNQAGWNEWYGSWWRRHESDGSDGYESEDDLLWADLEADEVEVVPSEILGWLLLRRSGLPASSRLSVLAATHNSIRFEDVERALRDQSDELLMAEHQHQSGRGPNRRTYWIEQNDQWGLLAEDLDEEQINMEQVHWLDQPPGAYLATGDEAEDDFAYQVENWYNDGLYDWVCWGDEWFAQVDDGSYVAYHDLKPWLELDEIAYHDPNLGKELSDIYAGFESKVRSFKEARSAVKQKGKSRGYFSKGPPKGKGKFGKGFSQKGSVMMTQPFSNTGYSKGSSSSSSNGPQKPGQPGYKGCFICGDKQHDFRSCPKRNSSGKGSQKGGKPIYMVEETPECGVMETSMSGGIEVVKMEEMETNEDLQRAILAADGAVAGQERLRYAVLDTGATETVGSLDALQYIMDVRQGLFGNEIVQVDPTKRKSFRFGNGESDSSTSYVLVPQMVGENYTSLGVYAMDVPDIPVLIGIKTMERLGAILDVSSRTIEFRWMFPGVKIRLQRGGNGHLLLDLCSNWMSQEADTYVATELRQTQDLEMRHAKECTDTIERVQRASEVYRQNMQEDEINTKPDQEATQLDDEQQGQNWVASGSSDRVTKDFPTSDNLGVSCHGESHESDLEGQWHDLGGSSKGEVRSFEQGEEEPEVGWRRSLRLEPGRRTRSEGSTLQRKPLFWGTHTSGARTWLQEWRQRSRPMGRVQQMLHPHSLCPNPRLSGYLPLGRAISSGCGDSLGREARGNTTRSLHQNRGVGGCRKEPHEEVGEDSRAEAPQPNQDRSCCGTKGLGKQGLCGRGYEKGVEARQCSHARSHGRLGEDFAGRSEHSQHLSMNQMHEQTDEFFTVNVLDGLDLRENVCKNLSEESAYHIESVLSQACNELTHAWNEIPGSTLDLLEVCCGPDSSLTNMVTEQGGKAMRLGLHNGYDMSTQSGLQKALRVLHVHKPRWVWVSAPCGPTSPIQHLNEGTPEKKQRSKKRKKKSRDIATNCTVIAKEQHACGRRFGWEWPRTNEAWQFPAVRALFSHLEANDQLHCAKLDGCMVGVRASDNGMCMKKPWLIKGNDEPMSQTLSIKCNGAHQHTECLGHRRAADSAFYPKKMCQLISKRVLQWDTFLGHVDYGDDDVFGNEKNEPQSEYPMDEKELKAMLEAIRKLHVRAGHPSNQALVNSLRSRGVSSHMLRLAKEFKCDECHEVRLPVPHAKVTLNKTEILWHTLQMDIGQIKKDQEVVHFLLMVDEASHMMAAHELFRHHEKTSRNATQEEVIRALESTWVQFHGYPNTLKYDPEGAFRGHNYGIWGQQRGIEMSPCAAEDHGAIGDVESLIGKIKTDARTFLRDQDCDLMSGVHHVVAVHNTLDRIGGFSPTQWAYGRMETLDGRFFEGGNDIPVACSEAVPGGDMQKNLNLRVKAEELYRKTQATMRISRALNSKPRPNQMFLPGDLVYYRRYKAPAQPASHQGLDQTSKVNLARWFGPARVLAMESRSEQGSDYDIRRPGHIVWVVAAGRLKRCSPHQLRHCSEREKIIAESSGGHVTAPWSFTSLLQLVRKGQYDTFDDIEEEEEKPSKRMFEYRPTRSRSRPRQEQKEQGAEASSRKNERNEPRPHDKQEPSRIEEERPPDDEAADVGKGVKRDNPESPQNLEALGEEEVDRLLGDPSFEPSTVGKTIPKPPRKIHRPDCLAFPGATGASSSHGTELERHEPFQRAKERQQVSESASRPSFIESDPTDSLSHLLRLQDKESQMGIFHVEEDAFACCAIEIELPEKPSELKKYKRDATAWMASKMKKSPEVRWSKLNSEQQAKFQEAKAVEINAWLKQQAVRAATGYVDPTRVMRMRWILTWKSTGKTKARLVVVGFEDPDILNPELQTTSPTMSRRSRQLLLTYSCTKSWRLLKGDVTAAFLQGDSVEEGRQVYAKPVKELAQALGAPEDAPVQLLKAAYGLVTAPNAWHQKVTKEMQAAGWQTLTTEPCMWRLMGKSEDGESDEVIGLASAHVDDFLFAGNESHPDYARALTQIYETFTWTPWEVDTFDHCGVKVTQQGNGQCILDHSKFCEKLEQVDIENIAGRKDNEKATENEISQLRALLGGIQWRVHQTAPQHGAQLSLLQSSMSSASVDILRQANKLAREVFAQRHVPLKVVDLEVNEPKDVVFIGWSDAALGNRPNGQSTGGFVIGATRPEMLQGKLSPVNIVAWKSGKLNRVARSSLAAEVQAFSETEEELMFIRAQWAEMCGLNLPSKGFEDVVKQIRGALVTDARSLYDTVQKGERNTSGLGLKEKYSALELLSVIQRLHLCGTTVRWVHSEAQLADAMTKRLTTSALNKVILECQWTLVEDPNFVSAKNLRKQRKT